ncbi:aspartate aminotransferase family protein [Marinobacterium arenosum]|uniref:aspartate aminotransferase family protein n=1 Tax=Marinobacterium arenosum TaxID=2862496 RepID=UPI0028F44413|nr:aspartate aminotransferase family protein [Marinobacterium arenosum]
MKTSVGLTKQLQGLDGEHFLHPFTDFGALRKKGSRIITRADGVYIWDSEGNQILDGMSGLWCCNLGYGRQEIVDAVAKQMQELPYYNSFFQCTHPPAIELARRLADIAPEHMNNVFFTGSGSEANDTVVRMVHRYWDLKGQPDKKVIIGRRNGYHGSTIAGASLGGMGFMHKQFIPLPYVEHIQQPYWYAEGGELSPEEFGLQAARELETKINELGVDKVAAFIAEPIQGAGGVIVPPATYWPEIKRICDEYGILLVVDEVIFGFGRTGKMFGSQYYDLKPDLMPFAKGVTNGYQPLGGVMVGDRVAAVLKEDSEDFAHGYTYSGHPVTCAAALATLDILEREQLVAKVADQTGPYLQQRWSELAEHPLVGETRGVGCVGALELVKNKQSRARFDGSSAGDICRDMSIKAGLVMRAVGNTMIIAPPLVLTDDGVDELVDKARKALDLTAKELGV